MEKTICSYCGTEYADSLQQCPLCGTASDTYAEEVSEPVQPKRTRKKKGAREMPREDKIPTWISVLVCIILGIAVLIGAVYAMYAIGIFSPSRGDESDTSLDLPIDDVQQGDDASNVDHTPAGDVVASACTGVTVSPALVRIAGVGESVSVSAVVQPAGCMEKVSWSSSDVSVCSVDENGIITSTGEGTAIVTASCGAFAAAVDVECVLTAENVNDASLDLTDFTLFSTGEQATIHVVDAPEDAVIQWSSSDTGVCTVDDGTVTAVKAGTATITVDVNGKQLECIVRCRIEGSVVATDDNAEVVGGYSLDHTDVTLRVGDGFEISVVNGVSGGWNVTDTSVISIDANGNVTAVGTGTAEVYTVVGGQRLECIVRVN